MDIEIPENLSDLSIEALEELQSQLRDRGAELMDIPLTPENRQEVLDETQEVVKAYNAVTAALTEAKATVAEAESARAEALAVFNEPAVEEDAEEAPAEFTAETTAETTAEVAVEATVDEVEAPAAAYGLTELAEAIASGVAKAIEKGAPAAAAAAPAPATVVAAERPAGELDLAALTTLRPAISMPQPRPAASPGTLRATRLAGHMKEGDVFSSPEQFAQAVHRTWLSFNQAAGAIPDGVVEAIPVAVTTTDFGVEGLTGDPEHDWAVLVQHRQNRIQELQALTASTCAPFPQIYDFFRLAEPQNPVERALSWMPAPRGGIRFIVPPDWSTAQGAIGTRTCEQDAYGATPPTPDKPVLTLTCPEIEEVCVDQISQRVRFKNLNFRTFPEQVNAVMADVNVAFVARKEQLYIDVIDGESTAVDGIATGYSAARNLVFNHALAAVRYRRKHHMNDDAVLECLIPYWAMVGAALDLTLARRDFDFGLAVSEIQQAFTQARLAVSWYYEPASGHSDLAMADAWGSSLGDFPEQVVSYMYAPGTFIGLGGETLSVGPVRDSALNGTNELELFFEEWRAVAKVGLDSVKLTTDFCVAGTSPKGVTARICAGS